MDYDAPPDLFSMAPQSASHVSLQPAVASKPGGVRSYLPYVVLVAGIGLSLSPITGTGSYRAGEVFGHIAGIGMVLAGGLEITKKRLPGRRYFPWAVASSACFSSSRSRTTSPVAASRSPSTPVIRRR